MTAEPRCICGCTADVHRHHRDGTDCGTHGRWICARYIPITERSTRFLTPAQRVALAESDMHLYRNLAALAPHARSGERIAASRVPAQRTAAAALYERRDAKSRRRRTERGDT